MDISERRVMYSPKYEGTNNLIKRQFRLNRMVCRAWVQKRTPLTRIGWFLRTEVLISTIFGLLILCSKNVLGL